LYFACSDDGACVEPSTNTTGIFNASLPKQYRYVPAFKHIILVADQPVCALSFGGKVVNINVLATF
jgi:hypothetical protein